MKQEDHLYEEWLTTLRSSSPTLRQPEEMTDNILARIQMLPNRNRRYLQWVSWASGIAAAFLLGFFVWETIFPPIQERKPMETTWQQPVRMIPDEPPQSFSQTANFAKLCKKYPQLFGEPQGNQLLLSEKGSQIAAILAQRQEESLQRRKQLESTLK